jgi:hypothetical protein
MIPLRSSRNGLLTGRQCDENFGIWILDCGNWKLEIVSSLLSIVRCNTQLTTDN